MGNANPVVKCDVVLRDALGRRVRLGLVRVSQVRRTHTMRPQLAKAGEVGQVLDATTDRTDPVNPHLAVADELDCPVQPAYLATELTSKESLVTIPDTRDERTVAEVPERPSFGQDPEPPDSRTHSVGVTDLVTCK